MFLKGISEKDGIFLWKQDPKSVMNQRMSQYKNVVLPV